MTVDQLKLRWHDLANRVIIKGFKSVIISSECSANIFIGINKEGSRCLILALPQKHNVDINSVVKEKLTIYYNSDSGFIVLQLVDNDFYDLFNDLIMSMYYRIKDIQDVKEYSREFVQTFYKWSEFFDDKDFSTLSAEAIKGLYGELFVLRSLIDDSTASLINPTLMFWRGPFDQVHDFVLQTKNIEVKTKDIDSIDIRISSEYQLQSEFEKGLELWVITVQNNLVHGDSIGDIVLEIKERIIGKLGDTSIFLKALLQKGLTFNNLREYDIYKFTPIKETRYDCLAPNFPKIIKSNLPKEINCVKYNLRTPSLSQFVISETKLQDGN